MADTLALPALRAARPEVVAGAVGCDRAVRWVHSSEIADIAGLLRGGELVLTTGIALPDDGPGLVGFVDSLVEVGAAGLVVELGRRWSDALPGSLVTACEQQGLPLVALSREVRFAAVAQEVGERIVDAQLAELRLSARIHETFTGLGVAEAGPAEVLRAAGRLAGAAVVLESEQHRVLDVVTGPGGEGFLDDWHARSRRVVTAEATSWDSAQGWLVARVGRRDRGWGRLVVEAPEEPPPHLYVLAERAAAALALHRLHDRDRHGAVRRAHAELVTALLADADGPDLRRRCELAGLPLERRRLVGVALRPHLRSDRPATARASLTDEVVAAVLHAAETARVPVLVCAVDGVARALLSLPGRADDTSAVDRLAATVAERHDVVVGVGRTVAEAAAAGETLREASHVLDALPEVPGPRAHRLEDAHVRGLLTLLGDDDRVRLFVDRELSAVRRAPGAERARLEATLRAWVAHPGNRTAAATALHVSRATFYDRLARLGAVLGRDLDDPETRLSLHLAVVAADLGA